MIDVAIGKVVRSNSHTDYVCQVHGPGEVAVPPDAADYAFGTFVRIPMGDVRGYLVGLVYNTVLLNPDFGNLGPRLSPASDLAIFSPDYLAEKVTLVGVTAIGAVAPDGAASHGIPPLAAQIDTLVSPLGADAVRSFHTTSTGRVQVGYAPLLLAVGGATGRHLLLLVIERLTALFPGQAATLAVLRNQIAWQAIVDPVGGAL